MSQNLANRIIDLSPVERQRLAAWLSQLEPVTAINRRRWLQLCAGKTNYLTHESLAHLMDVATPCGSALDVIRGIKEIAFDDVR